MSDLDEKLDGIIDEIANKSNSQGLKGLAFTWDEAYRERLKQTFIDDGWTPHLSAYHDAYIDGIKKEAGLMTGREWLSRALHTFYDYQNERDYFRNDEQFKASTVTMAEVETLLKKASGLQ